MGLFDSLRKKEYSKLNCNEFAKEFKKLYEKLENVQFVDDKSYEKVQRDGMKELEKFLLKQEPILNEMEDLCANWERKCGRNDANFVYADFIIHHELPDNNCLTIPSGAADNSLKPWFKKTGEEHMLRGFTSRGRYVARFKDGHIETFNMD